jgi:hypothetical protein
MRGCEAQMHRCIVIAVALLLCAPVLVGCDAIFGEQSNPKPWQGYAWSKERQKLRWWFDTFETRRDCLDAVANAVNNPPYNAWYSYQSPSAAARKATASST